MSNLASAKLYVQLESVQTRDPVGESVMQTIGGSLNFLLDTTRYRAEYKLNGFIGGFASTTAVDGLLPLDRDVNWEIIDVAMYGITMGTSSYVELDLLHSDFPNGAFTSIFSTKPRISSTASPFTTVHVGDTVTGTTSPILTANPLPVNPKSRFRLDVTNMQGGEPRDFGLYVYFRARG